MKQRRAQLEAIYWRMRRRIVPTLSSSQDIYETVLKELVGPNLTWLDVGCGHQILPEWRESAEQDLVRNCGAIVGMDYDFGSLVKHRTISLLVRGDITNLPFKDASFDLVTANMVVEHLDDPVLQFHEISRILKSQGLFLFHTPNARGYFSLMRRLVPNRIARKLASLLDGRDPEDIFPVHYKANTANKIELLARAAGLEVTRTRMVVSEAALQIIPPLAFFELIGIKALMTEPLKPFRTNIIALLRKCGGGK
jgi:ubiquinone/menaquinone biosynthesis C-methylase UbiE